MNFYIKDKEGNEQGPVDQETLEKWVELDKIFPDTLVRNALLGKYKEAQDFEFLAYNFEKQKKEKEQAAGYWEKRKMKKEEERMQAQTSLHVETAFKHEYIPSPASFLQRILASLFDWIILGLIAFIFWVLLAVIVWAGGEVNSVFSWLLTVYFILFLLYFGVGYGIYAQTVGMWFWGTFIVKNDISEVFLIRAFLYTLTMLLFGIVAPFVVFVHPKGRSMHDMITGTRIIKIAAKPKA